MLNKHFKIITSHVYYCFYSILFLNYMEMTNSFPEHYALWFWRNSILRNILLFLLRGLHGNNQTVVRCASSCVFNAYQHSILRVHFFLGLLEPHMIKFISALKIFMWFSSGTQVSSIDILTNTIKRKLVENGGEKPIFLMLLLKTVTQCPFL